MKNNKAKKKKIFLRIQISRRKYVILATITFSVLFCFWFLIPITGLANPTFLPSPIKVFQGLYELFAEQYFLSDIWASVYRVMLGFLTASALAVPLGILIGTFKSVEASLQPIMEFVRYLPVPAFLPLCILWFGIGDLEKVVVIFLGTFFQLIVLSADKARTVPEEFLEIGYTLGFKRSETIWKIVFPSAAPRIFDDLRVSCGWAWSYLVVAEIVAASKGVGFLIMQSQRYLQTENVIGGILVIGLLGLITDALFRVLGRLLFPWETHRK